MAEVKKNFLSSYEPTKKALFWSFVAGVVLTLGIGFIGLDWRTAGKSDEMTRSAVTNAEAELASAICVERFMASPDASGNLARLKAAKSWDRGNMIEEGGWISFSQIEQSVPGAASMCATKLSDMKAGTAANESKG